jgi:hypothetical protein
MPRTVRIVKAYQNGEPYKTIAERFGVDTSRVSQILNASGVKPNRQRRLGDRRHGLDGGHKIKAMEALNESYESSRALEIQRQKAEEETRRTYHNFVIAGLQALNNQTSSVYKQLLDSASLEWQAADRREKEIKADLNRAYIREQSGAKRNGKGARNE